MSKKEEVLLESGTNELEILEFKVGDEYYGINVMKVREILTQKPLTKLHESHTMVDGILSIRGDMIKQISLIRYLGEQESEQDLIIITEFNLNKLAFRVTDVTSIERISWKDIEPVEGFQESMSIIGAVKYEDRLVMVLDFESIVASIIPSAIDVDFEDVGKLAKARLAIADDSNFILEMVKRFLKKGGYENVISFHNGQEALDYLQKNPNSVDVLITDIEMPQMDGLTLCKRIKEGKATKHIIVMLYSSLITDDTRHKGISVGADFQVNKPQFRSILQKLNELL